MADLRSEIRKQQQQPLLLRKESWLIISMPKIPLFVIGYNRE